MNRLGFAYDGTQSSDNTAGDRTKMQMIPGIHSCHDAASGGITASSPDPDLEILLEVNLNWNAVYCKTFQSMGPDYTASCI